MDTERDHSRVVVVVFDRGLLIAKPPSPPPPPPSGWVGVRGGSSEIWSFQRWPVGHRRDDDSFATNTTFSRARMEVEASRIGSLAPLALALSLSFAPDPQFCDFHSLSSAGVVFFADFSAADYNFRGRDTRRASTTHCPVRHTLTFNRHRLTSVGRSSRERSPRQGQTSRSIHCARTRLVLVPDNQFRRILI